MSTHNETDPTAALLPSPPDADDLALYCIHCGYCLAGLTKDRCPECGESFDRDALTYWATTPNLPITCRPQGKPDPTLVTLFQSVYEPSRLGRELPPLGRSEDAFLCGLFARLLAMVIITSVGIAVSVSFSFAFQSRARVEDVAIPFIIGVSTALSSWVCEQLIARSLAFGVRPWGVPDTHAHRFAFWHNLCRCFAIWLPLTVIAILFGLFVAVISGDLASVLLVAVPFIGLPIAGWWITLARAIRARTSPSLARMIVIGLIPVIALSAIGLAVFLIGVAESACF